MLALLAPLMTKIDHVGQHHQTLQQVQTALVDFLPDLAVETFSVSEGPKIFIEWIRGTQEI